MIGLISFALKLYSVDFSLPIYTDDLSFALRAIAHNHGDFSAVPEQNPGWPLFISFFFHFLDSNHFIDYSNVVRILSMSITTFAILPMYLLGRKFFDEKYSLVVASLFAFEPHLNRWSTFGFSESLYILVLIGSFYFILRRNDKYVCFSFLLAGILWWIRLNGIVIFLALSIIFFINFRTPNLFKNYLICIVIFLVVISPILIQRYDQYGDPIYYYTVQRLFVSEQNLSNYLTEDFKSGGISAFDYIEKNGFLTFIHRFILAGMYNILDGIARISLPYLIILLPLGLIFSLRAFDQDVKYIRANWILILIILGTMVIAYSVIPEKRFLFPLLPFLIIFCTIPIKRVTEYGLSTFSFSESSKNKFILIVIVLVIILSALFTLRYDRPDKVEEQEKMDYARFLVTNLHGEMLDGGYSMQYVLNAKLENPLGVFKTFKIDHSKKPYQGFPYQTGNLTGISMYGSSIEGLISNGEQYSLKYIGITEKGAVFLPFLDDVYKNEDKYPYLIKVFDSNEKGFQKFKVKVFEIDYERFHKQNSR